MLKKLSKEEFMAMYSKDVKHKKEVLKEHQRDADTYMFEQIYRTKRKGTNGRYRMNGGD